MVMVVLVMVVVVVAGAMLQLVRGVESLASGSHLLHLRVRERAPTHPASGRRSPIKRGEGSNHPRCHAHHPTAAIARPHGREQITTAAAAICAAAGRAAAALRAAACV
jgi:hypothetical protein